MAVRPSCALPASAALAAGEPKPHFGTGGVSHVSGTSAQLEGSVNTEGLATTYFFEYGPTVTYGLKSKEVAVPIPAPLKAVKVGQLVTGILPGYHYRIVGKYTSAVGSPPRRGQELHRQARKLRFFVAKGKEEEITTTYGSVVSLTASLTGLGNADKPLSLQATPFPFTAPFTTLGGTVLSTRTGSFTFKVAKITQNTEFRFVALNPRPVYSPVVLVHVTPRISLHVRSAGQTGLYRLYGTVAPARPGAALVVQQLTPQKANSKRRGPRARGRDHGAEARDATSLASASSSNSAAPGTTACSCGCRRAPSNRARAPTC